jgi:type IV secretory pathway TraG/TraD family ATPase VirD4
MTDVFRIFQHILSASFHWLGRLTALLWPHKQLYTDRFATASEVQRLVRDTSYGLILGVDRFGRTLSVEATAEKPHLGHLAIFGPTGSGKTRREIRQLQQWKGSVIVNDPKCDLSDETAALRKKYGPVFFFAPSEGRGHTFDPFDGIEDERKLYNLAKHLLYVPNEREPAFTEWATKMLTQLLLAAKVAWKNGRTDLRPLPYVAWLINLGGLNDAAREVNNVSPALAQKLLNTRYQPENDHEQNPYRRSSWDSMCARLYPLLTEDIVQCFNGSDIKVGKLVFPQTPITIYLRWHESDLLALSPLIKFVWEAMISALITTYDLAPDKRKCQKVLLDIEEAGRTKIPNLPDHVSTLRSRNISITAVFQDRSQGKAVYKEAATSMFNNFRYQIYYPQDDLETAEFLERRCGGTSGFAHSKTEHEGSISRGESEQKIPLMSAQYIMYDMPEDEILGFWGKRPFLARRIPKAPEAAKATDALVLPPLPTMQPERREPRAAPVSSWQADPSLSRPWSPLAAASGAEGREP